MTKINAKEVAEFISSVNPTEQLIKYTDWQVWLSESRTKAFINYIISRKIELQNELFDINLDSKHNIAFANELKGGFNELGRIIDTFNKLIDRSEH